MWGFYAAFSRRSLRLGKANERQLIIVCFYAAFSRRSLRQPATSSAEIDYSQVSMPRSRGGPCDRGTVRGTQILPRVSMPRSRGGPCDDTELAILQAYAANPFLCRVLAAVPATCPSRIRSRCAWCRFYAAFSRRSLRRYIEFGDHDCRSLFLCRVLAAVPATLRLKGWKPSNKRFLCRVLAAVPATRVVLALIVPAFRFYAAFSRRSLRLLNWDSAAYLVGTFLCRVLAAVPATEESAHLHARAYVSMPRSRGGPCDLRVRALLGAKQWFLCRVLAAVPATASELHDIVAGFEAFLCRVLAAVPATAKARFPRENLIPFLCRVLAAVPATYEVSTACFFLRVSMPRSRGGPCDGHSSNG